MATYEQWRLIDTGDGSAPENMAIGEALLESCRRGDSPPALHLYTWEKTSITMGYFQELEKTVKIEECVKRDVEVVRRITGGKAVLHNKDVSFSLIFPIKGTVIPQGIGKSYLTIARGFILCLKDLGIDATLSDGRQSQAVFMQERREMSACFLTRIMYEVLYSGKKLIGSAQRRIGEWVLQQGTLLVHSDRELWAILLHYPDIFSPEEVQDRLRSEMVSLSEVSGKPIDAEIIKKGVVDGLSRALEVAFIQEGLSCKEEKEREMLVKKKYKNLLETCYRNG